MGEDSRVLDHCLGDTPPTKMTSRDLVGCLSSAVPFLVPSPQSWAQGHLPVPGEVLAGG